MISYAKYQLIILGGPDPLIGMVKATFMERIKDLGISETNVVLIEQEHFKDYKSNSPGVCLYFGATANQYRDLDELDMLIRDAVFILPVVRSLNNFNEVVPEQIRGINGFELSGENRVEALVASVMEGLSLLRLSRRLFISYRRKESRAVAIQLYEHLDAAGFDVFLDTHSIRSGEPFQEELWHRLVDTDIVVLLHTPGFLESEWTTAELARASAMSIGILQLIWPNHRPNDESGLCFPRYLSEADFVNQDHTSGHAVLKEDLISAVTEEVESLRARSLAARQNNIIKEFINAAKGHGFEVALQPEKFMTLEKRSGAEVSVIPTVGVPHAFTYNQSEELVKRIRESRSSAVYIVYDHRNIREKWQAHLAWLDVYLPIKAVKVTELDTLFNSF